MKPTLSKRILPLFCAGLLLTATGCVKDKTVMANEGIPAIVVHTQLPTVSSLEQRATFAGKITPDETVSVMGKVGGTVQLTNFEVGDTVKKGQVLYTIDPVDLELKVEQSRLAYETALKNIEIAESGSGDSLTELKFKSSIDQAQAAYQTAQTMLELAYQDDMNMSEFKKAWKEVKELERIYDNDPTAENYKKYKDSYDDYMDLLPSYSTYRKELTSFENSYNAYETALESYDIYKKQQKGENTQTFELQRQQAENGYNQALQQLDYTRVTAPIDGVIEQKNVSSNATFGTGTAAYVISNKSIVNVTFSVSSDIARAMSIGDAVEVESGNTKYRAEIVEIGNAVNSNSGLFAVKARIEEGSDLFTGLSVKLTAITAKAQDAMTIPISSVYYDAGKPYVYLAKEGLATKTPITLGVTTNDLAEVVEGLSPTDALIVTWNPNLNDKVAVSIANGEIAETTDEGAPDAAEADPAATPDATTPAPETAVPAPTTAPDSSVGQEAK